MNFFPSRAATYVYGVAPAAAFKHERLSLRVSGIGGRAAVRTIALGELVAVVSNVPPGKVEVRRENLLDHQRVLEEVLRRSDVLPFSFGAVAGSDEEVRDVLLRGAYDALREQLESIRGCVELHLKAFWEQERLFAEIAEENGEIRDLRDAIAMVPSDAAAMDKLELGQLTEAEIELKSDWEADALLEVLEPHAVDYRVSPSVSDTMVLNAAFLVERASEERFDGVVYGLGEAHAGRLTFSYVGPIPPYSFIDLTFETGG